MVRASIVLVVLFALFSACTQRLICPAYQSSFIYDQEALRQKFSYFKEDSTPKILTASTAKSRYLIAVPESYRKKFRRMQTVEMKPVYPVIPDSLKTQDTDVLMAERDVNDSTSNKGESADSVYAITKTKEKYNLDQDLYMWYFREVLVLPDVRAALENKDKKKDDGEAPPDSVQKKGGVGGLFKKKHKNDSTSQQKVVTDVNAPDQPKKKGGLFKKNKTENPKKKATDPAKKKEDGDGF